MRSDTLEALENRFRESPFLKGGEVPRAEIDQAAAALGASLPPDYVEFVERFGGGIVGPYPIFGLRRVDAMGRTFSVVDVTNELRKQNWPGTAGWIVVSEDHAGNPIGLAPDGKVWIADHDFGQVTVVAENFEHYLRKKCLKMES
ncbi:MAG: SMI1/KNR4 family protein [Verrucomicrobia bacterium]|nr:SMI1/KNR4 family protein [Verrucomicrobiota bacterium]